jgi:hypothetical protein
LRGVPILPLHGVRAIVSEGACLVGGLYA